MGSAEPAAKAASTYARAFMMFVVPCVLIIPNLGKGEKISPFGFLATRDAFDVFNLDSVERHRYLAIGCL